MGKKHTRFTQYPSTPSIPPFSLKQFLSRHLSMIMLFVCLVMSFNIYSNSIAGDFVYDDNVFHRREDLKKPDGLINSWTMRTIAYSNNTSGYRPLPYFTYSLTYNLFGESPVPFHITNILLHALASWLVFILVRVSVGSTSTAVFAALLFAAIPIHTENIANIKGREDILAAVFALLSSILLLKATGKNERIRIFILIGSYISFLLSLFSKELMITLFPLFPVIYKVMRHASWKKTLLVSCGYIVSDLTLILVRWAVYKNQAFQTNTVEFFFNPLASADLPVRVWTNFKIVAMYIFKTFIPYNLSAGYQYNHFPVVTNPFTSFPALAGICITLLIAAFLIKRAHFRTPAGIGLFLFLFAFIPLPKILFQASDIFAERWMYLPSVGLCIIAAAGIAHLYRKFPALTAVLLIMVLAVYGVISFRRNEAWLSRKALVEHLVKDAPNNSHAHFMLASYYFDMGNLEETEKEIRKSLLIYSHNNRLTRLTGKLAFTQEKYEESAKLMSDIPLQDPIFFEDHHIYARLLERLKKYDECITYITSRYGDKPPTTRLRFILGVCYYQTGNKTAADKYIFYDEKQKGFAPRE